MIKHSCNVYFCRRALKKVKDALKKRNLVKDKFRITNGYSWDYVIVFKVYKKGEKLNDFQKEFSFKKVLSALNEGGIETKIFYSAQVYRYSYLIA